jgi:OmpA-OmpF porin, OOP family
MKRTVAAVCGAFCAATIPALAQDAAHADSAFRPGWYSMLMGSRTSADETRQTGDGSGFVVGLGHRGDFAGLELSGLKTSLGAADLTGAQLALITGPFFDQPVLARLFGIVGFGVFRRENHPQFDEDDTTIFGDAGLGYMHPLRLFGRPLAIRGEVRYRYDVQPPPRPEDAPGAFSDVVFNLGLQIPLGREAAPLREAEAPPVEVVPVVAPDAEPVCNLDPAAGTVSLVACGIGDTRVLPDIRFASDSAALPEGSDAPLRALAQALQESPRRRIEIGAHTDSQGSARYNESLSERRAESVRAFLVAEGVNAGQLTATGHGESRPIDDNDTESGRARNRRVEVTVLE